MQKSSGKIRMFPGDVLQSAKSQWLRSFGDGFRNSVPCTPSSSSSVHGHPRLQLHTAAPRFSKPTPGVTPCTSQPPTPSIPCSCHPSDHQPCSKADPTTLRGEEKPLNRTINQPSTMKHQLPKDFLGI